MDQLPDELIYHILLYLDICDLIHLQQVSTRLLKLGRDTTLWKTICFDHSPAEISRRRRELRDGPVQSQEAGVGTAEQLSLAQAIDAYRIDSKTSEALAAQSEDLRRGRALANWEPGYPGEDLDYYEEYIQRHAKINLDWKQLPGATSEDDIRIATGAALLSAEGQQGTHAVCPLDDGSIVIYDLATRSPTGAISGHSGPGLLAPGARTADDVRGIMTNTGAVEVLSIDNARNRAFFAVGDMLHEVDLSQLSLVSSKCYSLSSITSLSTCGAHQSLVVGTNETIHLYDARDPSAGSGHSSIRAELIAGPAPSVTGHINLTQPGPTSIMHDPLGNESIWVAGRFTSMLQYSLRFFPRLESTVFSGARMSSMAFSPFPYIPRNLDLVEDPTISLTTHSARKSMSGWTAVCAGVYKGKGSLELYSMSSSSSYDGEKYLNRQTASSSKLLSVASHGGKVVCSDGNGNLRWMERNGYSLVRAYNINEKDDQAKQAQSQGLWANSDDAHGQGDIVQKIMPFKEGFSSGRVSEKLLLWTADGRLGTMSFGPADALQADEFHDAVEVQGESASERARHDAERQFSMAMRRALERNADEVRFVRGLGMGDLRP